MKITGNGVIYLPKPNKKLEESFDKRFYRLAPGVLKWRRLVSNQYPFISMRNMHPWSAAVIEGELVHVGSMTYTFNPDLEGFKLLPSTAYPQKVDGPHTYYYLTEKIKCRKCFNLGALNREDLQTEFINFIGGVIHENQ